MDKRNVPLFCIFGIEYPEIPKYSVSRLTLQVVNSFWTFKEYIDVMKQRCLEIMRSEDGDADFKNYINCIQKEHIDILEIRINTSRGVPKSLYYNLLLIYYDERRIGDHLLNNYYQSEHTVVQIYVSIRQNRQQLSTPTSIHIDHHYQPVAVSGLVRAMVKLRLVQAWQAAFSKYRDCRVRHVLNPRMNRDNDFTRIGIVEPLRIAATFGAASANDVTSGDVCMLQVLAYDKCTQQSCWFDILIAAHSTLRRCKERIVDALRQSLDWTEATLDEIPHLIARRLHNGEIEDFLLCDDTMPLSYIVPFDNKSSPSSPRTVPLLMILAFVGRQGRRVSDKKARCMFEEEEYGTQLLMAAMGVYLNSVLDNSSEKTLKDGCNDMTSRQVSQISGDGDQAIRKKISQVSYSKGSGSVDHIKSNTKLMAKERRIARYITNDSRSERSYGCIIL